MNTASTTPIFPDLNIFPTGHTAEQAREFKVANSLGVDTVKQFNKQKMEQKITTMDPPYNTASITVVCDTYGDAEITTDAVSPMACFHKVSQSLGASSCALNGFQYSMREGHCTLVLAW